MTQGDKDLLLKDVCARLPYGTKFRFKLSDGSDRPIDFVRRGGVVCFDDLYSYWVLEGYIIPYLRPMSSMTEEEKEKFSEEINKDFLLAKEVVIKNEDITKSTSGFNKLDWLNSNHFDYRGLIEKGLALEAPEGMYKVE